MNRAVSALAITLAVAVFAGAQEAELALTKIGDPIAEPSADDYTYTLHIENLGPGTATDVEVVDLLTNDAWFESASPGCTYDGIGHVVTCSIAGLAPAASVDFEIVVDVWTWPEISEAGLVLTGTAPAVGQPAAAMVGTRYHDHKVFATGGQMVTPMDIEGEAGPTLLIADMVDPTEESGGVPVIDGKIVRVNQSTGGQSVVSSGGELLNPTGIAIDDDGRIFVADPTGPVLPDQFGRVIEIDPATGAQTVLATGSFLEDPTGIEILTNGDLIVADAVGRLVRVNPITGNQTLISEFGVLSQPRAVAQLSPQAVLVADADSGLVQVELATGAQAVIMPIDGSILCEPSGIEIDYNGWCYVSDPVCGGSGVVHQIADLDPVLVYASFTDPGWECPAGIGLLDVFTNRASVTSATPDPDLSNNSDFIATEIEEGYEPPNEVTIDETVAVSDEVAIEVFTPVIIEVLESITVADLVSVSPAVRIDVSENVSVADEVEARPAVMISLVELITVSDHPFAAPALQIAVTESIAVTDHIQVLGPNDIFSDGFERGDTSAWSRTVGGP